MPSTSPKQRRFMRIAAHNPEFAAEAGISQKVAREFYEADKRKARRGTIAQAIGKARSRSER